MINAFRQMEVRILVFGVQSAVFGGGDRRP
jgi:hypothetical protein